MFYSWQLVRSPEKVGREAKGRREACCQRKQYEIPCEFEAGIGQHLDRDIDECNGVQTAVQKATTATELV